MFDVCSSMYSFASLLLICVILFRRPRADLVFCGVLCCGKFFAFSLHIEIDIERKAGFLYTLSALRATRWFRLSGSG